MKVKNGNRSTYFETCSRSTRTASSPSSRRRITIVWPRVTAAWAPIVRGLSRLACGITRSPRISTPGVRGSWFGSRWVRANDVIIVNGSNKSTAFRLFVLFGIVVRVLTANHPALQNQKLKTLPKFKMLVKWFNPINSLRKTFRGSAPNLTLSNGHQFTRSVFT